MTAMRILTIVSTLFVFVGPGCKEKNAADRRPKENIEAKEPASLPVDIIKRSRAAMGTLFDITVAVSARQSTKDAHSAIEGALAEIRKVDEMMSTWRPGSPISKLNAAPAGRPVVLPKELVDVIREAKKISRLTEGKFDISFAAMDGVWDFRGDSPRVPPKAEIKKKIRLIDWESIRIDDEKSAVTLERKGMKISLGAIAKGYAIDKAGAALEEKGFGDYIVYGGGDLLIKGKKGDRPWKVGIQDPRDRSRYFARLSFDREGAVVTSGDYEKFFVLNGRRYHHIIDPDTGYPAQKTVSVTIFADTSMVADALATGIFVLGPTEGMRVVESLPNVEALIVDENLTPRVSSGMEKVLELTPITRPEPDRSESPKD